MLHLVKILQEMQAWTSSGPFQIKVCGGFLTICNSIAPASPVLDAQTEGSRGL